MTKLRFRVVSKRQSVDRNNAQKWEISIEPVKEGAKAWAEDAVQVLSVAPDFAARLEPGKVYAMIFEVE